jgi:hypothetical protein
MSQFKNIPQPNDQRNVSQSDILSNFQYLASAQGGPPAGIPNGIIKVDHEQFGNNVNNPKDGFHNQVSFLDRGVPANLVNAISGATSDSILYTKTDGKPTSQLRFINSSIDAPVTYLSALVLFDGTGAILGNTQNVNNPGGVTKNGQGDFTVNFSVPLTSLDYLVLIQGFSSSGPILSSYSNKQLNSVNINTFTAGTTVSRVSPSQVSVMIYGLY